MGKYVKKPIVVEAVQMTQEMLDGYEPLPKDVYIGSILMNGTARYFTIETLEGVHNSCVGAWHITGPGGECWFIQDKIFKNTYEKVEE